MLKVIVCGVVSIFLVGMPFLYESLLHASNFSLNIGYLSLQVKSISFLYESLSKLLVI
jgi:hypothetical protein